jgi:glutamate--cysteine ligase
MSGADLTAPPSPPVESRADLVNVLASGAKPPAEWRIGTEHEKFPFYLGTNRPVPYGGDNGIAALLEGVAERTSANPVVDNEHVIGLKGPEGWNISLEPGGQFELSGAPVVSIHDTARETAAHIALSNAVAEPLGIGFLGMGAIPNWALHDIPLMPKSRYAIMRPYMDRVGTLGSSMMMRTCTIQANLDFDSEADMVKKFRVALALQPVATALFANSPFIDAQPSGFLSFRSNIWLNTDAARTGMLPFVFEDGFGFERYVDYALDVPMYFIIRNGRYVNVAGESFRAFLDGALPQLPGDKPTIKDWEHHLSTAFPEVRLKSFLEMRGADMGTAEFIPALSAFWTGLLYDELSLDAAWDLVKHWTAADRAVLRNAVPKTALHTPIPGSKLQFGTVADLAREVVGISEAGLVRRAVTNADGLDETVYLRPLENILREAKTPAEELLALYDGEWDGDVNSVFDRNRL